MKVSLQDDIRSFRHGHGVFVPQVQRASPDGPSAQRTGGLESLSFEADYLVFCIQFPGLLFVVEKEEDMMHHRPGRRTNFDSADPLVFGKIERESKVAVNIIPFGVDFESRIHLQNDIRFSETPAFRKVRQLRRFRRIANPVRDARVACSDRR